MQIRSIGRRAIAAVALGACLVVAIPGAPHAEAAPSFGQVDCNSNFRQISVVANHASSDPPYWVSYWVYSWTTGGYIHASGWIAHASNVGTVGPVGSGGDDVIVPPGQYAVYVQMAYQHGGIWMYPANGWVQTYTNFLPGIWLGSFAPEQRWCTIQ